MKLGDLVRFKDDAFTISDKRLCGIIIETGVYVGRRDVKVMWQNGSVLTGKSRRLEVISESR